PAMLLRRRVSAKAAQGTQPESNSSPKAAQDFELRPRRGTVAPLFRGGPAAITPPFRADRLVQGSLRPADGHAVAALTAHPKGREMPKMKTKSGAKKRFKVTGTGKVLYQQRGKRHGMIKRTKKQIRNHRGTAVLFKSDGDNIKKYF